jgi:hypothetical protein
MNERTRDHEVPLEPDEVAKVLAIASPQALLVGGQALAFWADYLKVPLPGDLDSGVTADVDFIGTSSLARELGTQLGWKTWVPTLDDATPHTGKVTQRLPDGGVKQVDFLSGVVGLTTQDIVRRAAELEVPGIGRLRVMHPVDVLDSRIQNLELLREKRTKAGVAQARLAVDVVRTYIQGVLAAEGERAGLKLLERIAGIALDTAAVRVFLRHGIDPLQAVPVDEFRTTPALQAKRWPQLVREVAERRRAASASAG